MASKTPENIKEVILILANKLSLINYSFRGTASLVLQNINMNAGDIDILCDGDTALKFNTLLSDYLATEVSYSESPQFKSYFGKFFIDGVQVEIMGNFQIKNTKGVWSQVYDGSDYINVQLNGIYVPCTKIDTELKMYAEMGRWNAFNKLKKEVELSKEKLNNQQRLF